MKEVSRKLFSSKQASDGREAHRGSVSGSEHSWAVQAPPGCCSWLPLGGRRVIWYKCVPHYGRKCVHV